MKSLLSMALASLTLAAQAQNLDYGAVPALTQPQSDQSAANQKLDFHTDQFTGRFNYEVPVEVPPGRGGSEPSVALRYNSANANGWCGVGWDLDPGYIQRETRHGVPISGNAYSDSFGFTFSVAGQSGRLVQASDGTYRPEVDTTGLTFAKTNGYWIVTDKGGRKYTFGDQPYTWIPAPPTVSSGVFKWLLSTVRDANGNLTSYSYQNPDYGFYYGYMTDYQLYPYQISYNANTNNTALTNNCTITFGLTTRPDVPNSCISGQEIPTYYRLNNILVSCNGLQVRNYYLQYLTSPSTGRPLLQYVTEYGSDNSTHWPSMTFSYSAQSQSFLPVQRWPITSQAPLLYNYSYTTPSSQNTALIDINGDGLPDWVSGEYSTSSSFTYYIVQTNTGSGFGSPQTWPVANEAGDTTIKWNNVNSTQVEPATGGVYSECKLVDINGDGLPDRVMTPGYSGYYFQVQTNTGNGFSSTIQRWGGVSSSDDPPSSPDWNGAGFSLYDPGSDAEVMMVDMDGDGFADLLMLGSTSGQFKAQLNTGNAAGGFQSEFSWQNVADANGIRLQYQNEGIYSDFMDMNGDGLPDRVVRGGVQLNLGNYGTSYNGRFANEQAWGMTNGELFAQVDWSTTSYYRQLVDINGDGLPDLVVVTNADFTATNFTSNTSYQVYYNTGNGFSSTPVTWTGVDSTAGPSFGMQAWDGSSTKTVFIDMNGDGLPDRVMRNNEAGGSDCLLVQLNAGPYPDLLINADNGIGGGVSVTYTNASTFNNSDGTRPRLPFPIHVVTSVSEYSTANPVVTTSYSYQYGYYDFTWREFRGFGQVSETYPNGMGSTFKRDTFFHQGGGKDLSSRGEYQDTRFKAGMPFDVVTYTINGSTSQLYHETVSQITQVQIDANGVYFPFATNVFELDGEPGSNLRATLKQYTYDVTPNNLAASTGNLLREADLGEITNFLYSYSYFDILDPTAYTTYTYTNLPVPGIVDKPASVTISSDAADNNILRQTKYQYFGATGDLQEKSELVCPSTYANTTYTYDGYGNPLTITDPMGIVTTLGYDPAEQMFPIRKITGTLTNLAQYDSRDGEVLAATNEQGLVSSFAYDPLLRKTSSSVSTTPNGSPSLALARYAYTFSPLPPGTHVSSIEPASPTGWHVTSTYVDGSGAVIQVRDQTETNGQYRVTDVYHDNAGHESVESYPIFSSGSNYVAVTATKTLTVDGYDAIGRPNTFYPLATASINGGILYAPFTYSTGDSGSPVGPASILYQDGGNPWAITVTNALGKVHKYLLDAHGRTNQIVEVTSAGNYTTTLAYDQVGDLTNITDNASNSIGLAYDLAGRRVAVLDLDMGFWQYNYDLDGRLKTQTDAKNQQIRLFYSDPAGRLTRREGWSAANQCLSTNIWTYDSNGGDTAYTVYPGQLFEVTDDEGWQKFSYDVRGRVLKSVRYLVKNSNTYTNLFTYDDADRVTSTTYPNGGPVITNIYDAGGHIAQVKQVGGTNFYTAKGFNELNQLNGINFGNGVGETFGYYSLSKRLQQITTAKTTNIQSLAYSFDADGNIKGVVDGVYTGLASGTVGNISYDDLNRLLSLTNASGTFKYGYNSIGNVLTNNESGTTNYVYGSIRPHAVRSANGTWFTYDQNGNAVFRARQRLDYDVNNRLYRVINTNGTATFFGYDANGARLWEQSGTNPLQVWVDGNYEEKQGQQLYHISAGGRLVATFDKTGTNVYQYYHPDDLTSTSIQTDSSGSLVQNYEYSAYGQSRYTLNTSLFKVSRRYTGQVLDDATGLYYYNARYYDPQIGRFTQPDDVIPDLFDPQTYNRYSYCVNNPLRFTDPTGHGPVEYLSDLGPVFKGFLWDSTKANFEEAVHVAIHPIDSGKAVVNAVENPGAAVNAVKNATIADWNSGLEGKGKVIADAMNAVGGAAEGGEGIATKAATQLKSGIKVVEAEKAGGHLVRFGAGPETVESLTTQAAAAEKTGKFPHGVSTKLRDRISGTDKSHRSAPKSEVEKAFKVEQTGADPSHHTVVLDKPVTEETVDKFNTVFKPKDPQ